MQKLMIWIGMVLGSIVGGYIPVLWGDSFLSLTALILSGVGAIVGIILAYKLTAD